MWPWCPPPPSAPFPRGCLVFSVVHVKSAHNPGREGGRKYRPGLDIRPRPSDRGQTWLDVAVFIARHVCLDRCATATAATHPRTAVDPSRPCVEAESDAEDQLCVPLVSINGPSYRLKDRLKPSDGGGALE